MAFGKTLRAAEMNDVDGMLDKLVKNLSNTTEETVTLFYASLLEYHGTRRGDGTIKAKDDALDLLYAYLEENEGKTLYDVYSELMELIAEDNFFEKTGLNQRLSQIFKTEEPEKKSEEPEKKSKARKSTKTGANS